jgi:radical SAM superfamily enzyme YgiQ (UPF0313 family)
LKVKFILPALTEAKGKYWRPIKYSLFPPLGLATLAGYLNPDDEATIYDEHVEKLCLDDEPQLVAIETYITSANRAYSIADSYRRRGIYVVMGGLHVTACPCEALKHADTIVVGPAEEAWPRFLADFRRGNPQRIYRSYSRDLGGLPPIRRDLINSKNYLVPNSIVVSRGCPHGCDFCYCSSFFRGGRHFYTCEVDRVLMEIEQMPGRHLFFLDDNLFGDAGFASTLFSGMRGMGRIWQGAATVKSILNIELLDRAVESGLRSLFVGFESLNQEAMRRCGKNHNHVTEYEQAVKLLHERGVMINASFVYGLDQDGPDVFDATAEWAIEQGIETSTFHILTPYPGTKLYSRYEKEGRIMHRNWGLYDTRHAVFRHPKMSGTQIEAGYWRSYEQFYSFSNIIKAAMTKPAASGILRHLAYVTAWKKCDPLWAFLIKMKKLGIAVPHLERVLKGGTEPYGKLLHNNYKEPRCNELTA